jgi:trimeric autotransporter adhesin
MDGVPYVLRPAMHLVVPISPPTCSATPGNCAQAKFRRLCSGLFAVLAITAATAPALAQTANPVRGASLYANTPGGTSCANSACHRTNPASNANKILRGANSPTTIQNAINNNTGGMGIYRNNVLTPTDVADIAAYLGNPAGATGPVASLTPTTLSFASTAVGSTSGNQTVTLRNSGNAALAVSAITITSADFAIAGGTCAAGGSVAAGGSCTISVVFRPQAAGARSGSLSVTHNATGSPSVASLSGTATAATATVTVTPATLSFGAQNVGTSSTAQTITVSNTGSALLSFTGLSFTGANGGDFLRAGSCAVGSAVAVGASCTAVITFAPQAAGTRSAALTLASNASNSSVDVVLSGTANAAALPAVNPSSLSFGTVTLGVSGSAQSVTISNTGTLALVLGAITVTDPQFAITGGSCAVGGSVAAGGGSCTVQINFTPSAAGAASATLSVAHNAANSPLQVALAGTGTAPAAPVAQLAPAALSFSQVLNSPSPAQLATLMNTGTTPLVITSIGISGAAAADYALGSGSSCVAGGSVAAGASCSLSLVFTPSATGARNATLSVAHNDATHSPSTIALNGTGTASPSGLISVNQIALSFATQAFGSTSAAQTVTVSNSGSAALTLSSLAISGANASDFALTSGANACTATTTLLPAATCAVYAVFAPTVTSGGRTASLIVNGGAAGTATISLSGSAAPAAAPIASFSPPSLSFGAITTGQTSAAMTVSLSNSGSAPLLLTSLSATPAQFVLSHNCPASLAAAASCTLTLSFAPTAVGAASGLVTLVSNAANGPNTLALSGSGVAPAAAALNWLTGSTLSFADTAVGTQSAPQSLVLLNSGGSAATLQAFQFAGAAGNDFLIDPASSCAVGGSLASGANCALQVVFAPTSAGPRAASLSVSATATAPPAASLSGNGISSGVPVLGLAPTTITLTGPPNQPLQAQVLVIRNDGAAPLRVTAVQAGTGLGLLDASATGGGTCMPAPFTLAPGATCTLVVEPLASSINSSIQVASNASAQPAQITVSGTTLGNAGAGGSAGGLIALAAAALWRRRARTPQSPRG